MTLESYQTGGSNDCGVVWARVHSGAQTAGKDGDWAIDEIPGVDGALRAALKSSTWTT